MRMAAGWMAVAVASGLAAACGDSTREDDTRTADVADAHDADDAGDAADAGDAHDADDAADAADADDADDVDDGAEEADLARDAALEVPPDRAPGTRAPLTARCDESEPLRCFLPWPSSVFLARDETRASGVRLALEADVLPPDEGLALLAADGFSRVTPIVAPLPLGADGAGVVMRVFLAEPGETFGREVPIDVVVVPGRDDADRATLVGYPLAPLAAASEHVVVVEAPGLAASEDARAMFDAAALALGRRPPSDADEARRVAAFAPARAIVADRAIDPGAVYLIWDFITRSADDARAPLRALAEDVKAQVRDGSAAIALTSAVPGDGGAIALVVEGTIGGLVDATAGAAPIVYEVPFRVVVPAGDSDYHIVMYGHGTGGDVHDRSFDELIARSGAAKVNTEIDGWTGETVPSALAGLLVPIAGTRDLTLRMRRAIAGIAAIQEAVLGPIGDLLAAPQLLGQANPAAGRRPRRDTPIWAGGSLGGVIGCVYGHLEPTIAGGILNVPGAAFTHWLARSSIGDLLDYALARRYPAMVDQQVAAAMAQTLWDEVDGAVWAGARDPAPIFVVQMSVGDPIMPNNGTAMVATALDALMLVPEGASPLLPVVGLERADHAVARSALTEFVTNETAGDEVHGFAARDAPAGLAARAQFEAFIATLWAGAPVITIPDACAALPEPGLCDFSAVPLATP